MEKELAVVLLSGGIDSGVTCAIASKQYKVAIIHFNYGQRNQSNEKEAVENLVKYFEPEHYLEFDLLSLGKLGGSSLTDITMEIPNYIPPKGVVPSTYLPFRNGIMLAIAASWAEIIGAKHIFIGVVEEDSSGYPDTTIQFIEAMEKAINLGRKPENAVKIHTPVINMKKSEIILLGAKLGFPFQFTWSCYRGGRFACGECPSCLIRKRAFNEAGVKDPIGYEK